MGGFVMAKSITNAESLRTYLTGASANATSALNVDEFLREVTFESDQLTGMRYDGLMVSMSINEFLSFLDAAGIPRAAFLEPQARGCGKNYKGTKGNCKSRDGY